MARVHFELFKVGTFKVTGEKPRVGYFEDNVLVNETGKIESPRKHMFKQDYSAGGNSLILAMIPETVRRKKRGSLTRRRDKSVMNPVSSKSDLFEEPSSRRRSFRSRHK